MKFLDSILGSEPLFDLFNRESLKIDYLCLRNGIDRLGFLEYWNILSRTLVVSEYIGSLY